MKFYFGTLVIVLLLCNPFPVTAQYISNSDSVFSSEAPNTSRLWMNVFGDYYYKAHTDSLNRGAGNQYTGIPATKNAFAFRRIYLGYDYNISKKFTTELLLAAEDNVVQNLNGTTSTTGDLLSNNKLTFYIKWANIRWKNIWKGTDLIIGQSNTPAFGMISEKTWSYRPIEKTIADIRRTPAFDMGLSLQSKIGTAGNFGYDLMVGNGTGARPENDKFKWFYGDVYAKLFNKKLILDFYSDYERINWQPGFHHARSMYKVFAAYNSPSFTFGVETFINRGIKDVIGFHNSLADTLNASAVSVSIFLHGDLIKNKLRYFIRFDHYDPDVKYNNIVYSKYLGLSANYEPSNKENFFTTGLDLILTKTVHLLPNIWYNQYISKSAGNSNTDHDLVYRLTFQFYFGK